MNNLTHEIMSCANTISKRILKFILISLVHVCSIHSSAQFDSIVTMNHTALPEYYKISMGSRGAVIKAEDSSFVVSINSYTTHKIAQNSIELRLNKQQFDALKSSNLSMKISDSLAIEKNRLILTRNHNRRFEFELSFTQNSELINVSGDSEPYSDMGYIIVQHRLGRSCSIYNPNNNRSFNLGIFDKSNLGAIGNEDIISLSYDQFFKPLPNRFSCNLQDSIIVNFENTKFLIEWLGAYQVRYRLIDAEQQFDLPIIYLDENLADFTIEELGQQLSNQLITDRTLISFWAGFCPPCIESIPKLNALGDQVIGFQMDKEDRSIDAVHFRNYSISNENLTFLGINGFPNYMVIDRNLHILYSGRDAQNAIDALNAKTPKSSKN